MTDSEPTIDHFANLRGKITREQEITKLLNQYDQLSKDSRSLVKTYGELVDNYTKLEAENAELKKDIETWHKIYEETKAKEGIKEILDKNEQLKARVEELEGKHDTL